MAGQLAMIALLVLPCWPAKAEGGGAIRTFSGWTGTCNNLDDCVASAADGDGSFYLQIARAAGPRAVPKVKVLVEPGDEAARQPAAAVKLDAIERGKRTTLAPIPAKGREGIVVAEATAEQSRVFVEAIRNADKLDYAFLSNKGTLDLKGLAATLRWMDARQGRAGTLTALVAHGPAPASQVPARRSPQVIRAAEPGSVAEIAKPVVGNALVRRVKAMADCVPEDAANRDGYSAWRLRADTILVAAPCVRAAYNAVDALFFTDAHGGSIRPARLPSPSPEEKGLAANVVSNLRFDTARMTLSEFMKGRGIGDCGGSRTWVWTGERFELLEATRMDACPGAPQDDWPNLYLAAPAETPPKPSPRKP